jgi:hypothetical protein
LCAGTATAAISFVSDIYHLLNKRFLYFAIYLLASARSSLLHPMKYIANVDVITETMHTVMNLVKLFSISK